MFIKAIGLTIIIVGLIITLYTGLDFVTQKEVVVMGSFQVTKDNKETFLSPLIGIGVMIIGGVIFVGGNRKHFRQS